MSSVQLRANLPVFLAVAVSLASPLAHGQSAAQSAAAQGSTGSVTDPQANQSGNATDSQASQTVAALNEIVVTAERRASRLQDVPFTVETQSGTQLAQAGVSDMRELPMLVSGLTWNGQGGWQEPNIRGVYTNVASPGSGSPIAIYLDGVYQPSQAGTPLDLPDVSRIEVLKGPQGTLFGMNATGGAIQVFTAGPEFTFGGNASVTAGDYSGGDSHSAGHEAADVFVTGPLIPDTLAGSLSVDYDNSGGYVTNLLNGSGEGVDDSKIIRGKLLWKLTDQTSVLLTGYYVHHDDALAEMGIPVNGVTVASEYPGSIYGLSPWQGAYDSPARPDFGDETIGSSVRIAQTLDAGTLTSLTAYTHYMPLELVDTDMSLSPGCYAAFACINYTIHNPERTGSEEFNFTSNKFGGLQLVSGAYFFYDRADEYDRIDPGLPFGPIFSSDSHIYTKEQALYGEATYDITSRLSGVLGVRLDHQTLIAEGLTTDGAFTTANPALLNFANKSWASATPRASLRYQLTRRLSGYFTFSEGFKGGVVGTQYNTNPPANPEKLYSYELGLKYAQPKLVASAATYFYDYKDLQQEYFNGTIAFPRNAASAHIAGLDADITGRLSEAFQVRFSGSWLPEAKYMSYPSAVAYTYPLTPYGLTTVSPYDASGSRMLNTPRFTGSLTPIYTHGFTWGRLESSATIHYSDNYRWELTGRLVQPAYTEVNAQISVVPEAAPQLRATLYGKNLTSRAVLFGALLSTISDGGFYGPPREVGVRLDYAF